MALDVDPRDVPIEGEDDDRAIVREAHRRFQRCQQWESQARKNWLHDLKFSEGDSLNNWQWPDYVYNDRNALQRPTLTVNECRLLCLHIINEAKQKKSGIKFRPVGNGANVKAAEVWEGIIRHIQNVSKAQKLAHGPAIEYQVKAGLGFTRVMADFSGPDTFDQEAYIRGVQDVMSCYLDPDHKEIDGSDARYGFVFANRAREAVEEQYPDIKGKLNVSNGVDDSDAGWLSEDQVREAEYYKIIEDYDELIGNEDGLTILKSEIAPTDLLREWEAEAEAKGTKLKRRPVVRKKLKWYKIVGYEVVDKTDPPGETIPIVPWYGERTVIDNRLDIKGHTRALISAQQMMNYNRSAAVEFGALQSKTPYLVPVKAIENLETYWETANRVNHAYLPYNHIDDDGKEIPAPQRQNPPISAPVYMEGAEAAHKDMQIASGQYDADIGAPSNERSGRAINERQRQGDRATYHYTDNQATAICREAELLVEIVPKIYDTARVIRILGEDGKEDHVQLDPTHPDAYSEKTGENGQLQRIFNPNVGRYEIVPDVGPDYATERQEAFDAIVQILTQAPVLIDKIGDLLFRVADFPLADEIAERLKPGMPPEAQKAIENLQTQLQKANKLLGEAMQALTEERLRVKAKDQESDVKAFDADTRRLAVVKDMLASDPAAMHAMIRQIVIENLQDNLGPVRAAGAANLSGSIAGQPIPGATGAVPPPQGMMPAPSPRELPAQ